MSKKIDKHIPINEVSPLYDAEDVKLVKAIRKHWKERGQPWRTEPEIDEERQKFLAERRSITPDSQKGIYPFQDIILSRADIEWLLATHENGRGPIDWSDESQRGRYGLDIRGAYLRNVNLMELPLACLGKVKDEIVDDGFMAFYPERNDTAAIHLEGAALAGSHLEGADLRNAHLEKAFIIEAHLEKAHFHNANLKEAKLWKSNLRGAWFWG